jgi:hypothetical protein
MNSCKYCGMKTKAGGSCRKSPHKYHEVDVSPELCIYCGLKTRAGGNCLRSPIKTHVLGR